MATTKITMNPILHAIAAAGLWLLAGCAAGLTPSKADALNAASAESAMTENVKLSSAQKADVERRERYINEHPELTEQIKSAIRNSSIAIGMTESDVRTSAGPPRSVSRSIGLSGTTATMSYGHPLGTLWSIHLTNGKVSSMDSYGGR